MKRIFCLLTTIIMVASSVQAEDYHYMTFVMTDRTKASVDVENLSMAVSGNKLVTGDKEFIVENLQKMYFSMNNESTTAISAVESDSKSKVLEVYDLQGKKVKDMSVKGIYIVKTTGGTYKMMVR